MSESKPVSMDVYLDFIRRASPMEADYFDGFIVIQDMRGTLKRLPKDLDPPEGWSIAHVAPIDRKYWSLDRLEVDDG